MYRCDQRFLMSSTRQNMGAILCRIIVIIGDIAYPLGDIVIIVDINNIPKFRIHITEIKERSHFIFILKMLRHGAHLRYHNFLKQ